MIFLFVFLMFHEGIDFILQVAVSVGRLVFERMCFRFQESFSFLEGRTLLIGIGLTETVLDGCIL